MTRDRITVWTCLTAVTAIAWICLIRMSASMGATSPVEALRVQPWEPVDFGLILLMWIIMMVAMMVPTAAPMTMAYAVVSRKVARDRTPVPPTMVFASGYVALWVLFSVVAVVAQWGLEQAAVLSPMMVTTSPTLGAGLLIVAGMYQFTPFKWACLNRCRSPAHFLATHWRDGVGGAFRMGVEHGAFCVGCCWALMGLLFVGGVMNLLWLAVIAFFVLLEKVIPRGRFTSALAGGGLVLAGLATLVVLY